ncbi:hypothetical protein AB4114_03790 [Paenibacillus sp. 2RAB27]
MMKSRSSIISLVLIGLIAFSQSFIMPVPAQAANSTATIKSPARRRPRLA